MILQKLGTAGTMHVAEGTAEAKRGSTGKRSTWKSGKGREEPKTPPEMSFQCLLLIKLNIMPTDKGEILRWSNSYTAA